MIGRKSGRSVPQSKPGYAAMPGQKLTEEKRRQVLAALNVNSNATAVASQIGGVSAAAVWKIAKKAGIELTAGITARGCNNRVPPDKRAEIVAALNVNPNATAVAREVGGSVVSASGRSRKSRRWIADLAKAA